MDFILNTLIVCKCTKSWEKCYLRANINGAPINSSMSSLSSPVMKENVKYIQKLSRALHDVKQLQIQLTEKLFKAFLLPTIQACISNGLGPIQTKKGHSDSAMPCLTLSTEKQISFEILPK